MAHSWSFADGAFTLTLDGTGSGPVSCSRTFTDLEPNQLYTFYLEVNPSVVAIGAFFQVDGGDTTIADVTGSQTLRARGTTNGSGEITLRFGAQSIESAPTSEGAFPLDYPDQAAAEADDWTVTNTAGNIAITFDSGHAVGDYPTSVHFYMGSGPTSGEARMARTFAKAPNTAYVVRLAVDRNDPGFEFLNLECTSGASTVVDGTNTHSPQPGVIELSCAITTDVTGNLTVAMVKGAGYPVAHDNHYYLAGLRIEGSGGSASARFSPVARCLDSGAVARQAA